MTERNKNILLAVLIVGVVSMTIAFAALSSNLNINGSASVQNLNESWNIHFAHISNTANEVKTYGYASADSSITVENTTVTVPEVTFKAPGDKVEYLFKVVNVGDITGYINVLNNIGIGTITYGAGETLTPEQKTAFQNDIQVTLTYNNPVEALQYNDTLAKGDEKELILTIQYVNRDSAQVLPTKDVTFTGISASIIYGQDRTSLSGTGDAPAVPEVVSNSKFNGTIDTATQYSTASVAQLGLLGVAYLDPTNLKTECDSDKANSSTGTKQGCMKFYIYAEDSTSYTMILDHNTTAKVAWNSSGNNSGEPVTANIQLSTDTAGWVGTARLISAQEVANITGTSWDESTATSIFYFEESQKSGQGTSAYTWLFDRTKDCISYGCNVADSTNDGYWTSTFRAGRRDLAWTIKFEGYVSNTNVRSDYYGIRPVMTIAKEDLGL